MSKWSQMRRHAGHGGEQPLDPDAACPVISYFEADQVGPPDGYYNLIAQFPGGPPALCRVNLDSGVNNPGANIDSVELGPGDWTGPVSGDYAHVWASEDLAYEGLSCSIRAIIDDDHECPAIVWNIGD